MTHVSTPTPGALPRQRTRKRGSMIGAAALVIATGAAIAVGIAVSTDEAPAVNTSANTFTQAREAQPGPRQLDSADRALLNRAGASQTAQANAWPYPVTVEDLVKNGYIPGAAEGSSFTETPGQPR